MTIHYHDPRAALATAPEPYTLRADFAQPLTVGLLANGFPDSAEFLAALAVTLQARLPAANFRHYNKDNPSVTASAALLATISAECQVVASAYGH